MPVHASARIRADYLDDDDTVVPGGPHDVRLVLPWAALADTAAQPPVAVILIVDRVLVREHVAAGEYDPAICVEHTTRLDDGGP